MDVYSLMGTARQWGTSHYDAHRRQVCYLVTNTTCTPSHVMFIAKYTLFILPLVTYVKI